MMACIRLQLYPEAIFMKKTTILMLALAIPALSQTTIKEAMAKHWKATGELTIAVADAMPAADYNFRPNPEEMSFGQLMAHIGSADRGACANASGMTPPAYPEKIAAYAKDTKLEVDKESEADVRFLQPGGGGRDAAAVGQDRGAPGAQPDRV
jgi:hypothetical protein